MSGLKIPEINLTSDSDDLNEDNWFTSPTTSFDGSSINSIPWAEDVIKQNKDEWDNIEGMFYGETELPADEKLRSEILEWTNRFPHLRVVGKQASIYFGENGPCCAANFEEILAIHPTGGSARHQITSYHGSSNNGNGNCAATNRRMEVLYPVRESHTSLDDDIEKHLQISSRPLLTRRNLLWNQKETGVNISRGHYGNNHVTPTITRDNQMRTSSSALHSVRSSYDVHRIVNDNGEEQSKSLIHSARPVNVPALKAQSNVPITRIIRISTANLVPLSKPLRNSLTLPAINIVPIYTESLASYRAFSPQNNQISTNRSRLPPSVALKRRSESE